MVRGPDHLREPLAAAVVHSRAMTTTLHDTAGGTALVDQMADVVLAEAGACQEARTLTAPVVDALWRTGLMTYMNPAAAGGAEPSFGDMIDTWQRMAWLDGSFSGVCRLGPLGALLRAYSRLCGAFGWGDRVAETIQGLQRPFGVEHEQVARLWRRQPQHLVFVAQHR